MPRNLTRALQASSFLLVMSGYLALITTQRYSAALTFVPLFFYAIAPIGEYLDVHFRWYRRATAIASLLGLAAALASLAVLDLLTSVTLLVIYIQAYTLLHRKRVASYHHLHLMAAEPRPGDRTRHRPCRVECHRRADGPAHLYRTRAQRRHRIG
ncbi:MAG: hypothetical protein NTU83_13045 [Candidatus Hydrogenedentes bacterium]|nr:hypothetical protein [Candidatus Hydrogenedentota bacterium]